MKHTSLMTRVSLALVPLLAGCNGASNPSGKASTAPASTSSSKPRATAPVAPVAAPAPAPAPPVTPASPPAPALVAPPAVVTAAPSGPGVPADGIDLTQATVLNSPPDVATWAATTKITTLEINANGNVGFQIQFTKRDGPGSWPDYVPPGFGGPIEYTLWAAIQDNGKWYTSGVIQIWRDPSFGLWEGGAPSAMAIDWFYDPGRWAPLTTHQPVPGERVGFFVTAGNARNETAVTSLAERSNVILVPFPADTGTTYNYP